MAALWMSAASAAPLIFTAPPRETKAAAEKLYGPLAKAMTVWSGEKVVYKYAGNWLSYSNDMRAGKYDIIFDGPQFVSWRMAQQGAVPLASLPGKLQFVVATTDPSVKKVSELVAQKVCTIPSPNIGALFVLDQFKDPMQQPVIVPVTHGGQAAIYKAQAQGECVAAIYRTGFYDKKLTDVQRSKLNVIYTSRTAPNQTITAAKSVPAAVRKHIADGLVSASSEKPESGILARYAQGAKHFVKVDPKDFKGLDHLLEDVVWGWAPQASGS